MFRGPRGESGLLKRGHSVLTISQGKSETLAKLAALGFSLLLARQSPSFMSGTCPSVPLRMSYLCLSEMPSCCLEE